ncbi:MAG: seg [Candidatus Adlerbacteria bacterium]|nr:seg [Candidatus Adlerbacteria bacterium]
MAIFIVVIAIAGPITIAQKGLIAALVAKDQVNAFYLAQDAVEYVRFVRDTNRLSSAPTGWLAGLDGTANGHTLTRSGATPGSCVSSDGLRQCTIDSLKDFVEACDTTCPRLNYDPSTNGGYYTYESGGPSLYTRTISIQTVPSNPREVSLVVKVSWQDTANIIRSVTVHENLLDWQ